ncbi:MAG: D-alanyl-D-alanine-carboxypeptidase/endopeptidase AmpH [Brucella pseudogrignonensis]
MRSSQSFDYRTSSLIRALLISSSLVVMATQQSSAEDLALKDAVSMTGMALFLNSGAPALTIAVVRGDESIVQGFGETVPGNDTEPNGKSIFRLGSISKVFATDVLTSLAADGKLKLTDPLAKYAPDGASVKQTGRPITLLDLATHSAGLPRELADPSAKPSDNPFDAFNRDYYWKWIGANAPAYVPGTTTLYSNFGYGLMGDALAKAGNSSFADLLKSRVFEAASMADTTTALNDEQKKRMMVGLDPFNKNDPNNIVPDIMYASAGVYSTADDMVKWMQWHLNPTAATMEAHTLDHTMWLPYDGLERVVGTEVTGGEGMGLGWVVTMPRNGTPMLLGKSGGLGGFMTYVVLSPNHKLGIFVVANRVNFGMFNDIRSSVHELAAELGPQ